LYKVRKNNSVYIYYRNDLGKNTPLPRSVTRHLDSRSDDDVDHWMRFYQQTELGTKLPPLVLAPTKLKTLLTDFNTYLMTVEKLDPRTVSQHRGNLNNHILPFFLSRAKGLNDWPLVSHKLMEFQRERDVTAHTNNRVNITLRKFFRWAKQERLVDTKEELYLRNDREDSSETPLGRNPIL
jgi:hypothetical protein